MINLCPGDVTPISWSAFRGGLGDFFAIAAEKAARTAGRFGDRGAPRVDGAALPIFANIRRKKL